MSVNLITQANLFTKAKTNRGILYPSYNYLEYLHQISQSLIGPQASPRFVLTLHGRQALNLKDIFTAVLADQRWAREPLVPSR
jgi:hypothetical protein